MPLSPTVSPPPPSIHEIKVSLGLPNLRVIIPPHQTHTPSSAPPPHSPLYQQCHSPHNPLTPVTFHTALRHALTSLCEDGTLRESPLWVLREIPGDYGLGSTGVERGGDEERRKVREYLDRCTIELISYDVDDGQDDTGEADGRVGGDGGGKLVGNVVGEDGMEVGQGKGSGDVDGVNGIKGGEKGCRGGREDRKIECDETGECFESSRYWIFVVNPSEFTDVNYVVVDKFVDRRDLSERRGPGSTVEMAGGRVRVLNWGFS
eukprot:GHVQ01024126.1.p1 GENE.GHVQ01024126.1~~GHVQ01024126.1.p1  ORF type:complete len:262 (-),score=59.62 GHVQ01024126.1:1213-1998(-)